ncbi:PREDICTED: F-actin-capping protein subunit alpha-1-like [Gekko japonicus]|uniref:F-actin-capping protein subunit alpha n=1 Tax=Gekko japonicus TaxID=146911 RepID=A0ABM1L0Z9_GEKJA|nr:PREDICTED: F-actin-capping protein subunit alpha-1-like [Gekko japonicus]
MSKEGESPEEEKTKMICGFLHQAPPNEFNDIFEDLRILVMDDQLMRTEAAHECANHNRKNFKAVKLLSGNSLVTHYNDLKGNRFFDPQSTFSFRYDHLTGRTDKFLLQGTIGDDAELWRSTLNAALNTYMKNYFSSGTCCVFRKDLKSNPYFVVCLEGHQFRTSEFNGLWTSEWTFAFTPPTTEVTGNYRLQIHYFRKANWHLAVDKTVQRSVSLINRVQFAMAFTQLIEAEDNEFQMGLEGNLQELSVDLWKTLRRRIPITRTVIGWDKLLSKESTKVKGFESSVSLSMLKVLT